MDQDSVINVTADSRELVRSLRLGFHDADWQAMPESGAWQAYQELQRRGEPRAKTLFIGALRTLHSRRVQGGLDICNDDVFVEEHRLTEDRFLADLWKAYKKCIRTNRTGPASHLLRDIEEQLS
ncbi:MAG: hypothetical protein JXX28_15295 [Deltaproteobacteria bacterium]|nr:hypothetical protein [Deltaproteobacteria bacterium]